MPTAKEITFLAKAIHASHYFECTTPKANKAARAIPWPIVEAEWARATTKERADYRWEAAQVLRTVDKWTAQFTSPAPKEEP